MNNLKLIIYPILIFITSTVFYGCDSNKLTPSKTVHHDSAKRLAFARRSAQQWVGYRLSSLLKRWGGDEGNDYVWSKDKTTLIYVRSGGRSSSVSLRSGTFTKFSGSIFCLYHFKIGSNRRIISTSVEGNLCYTKETDENTSAPFCRGQGPKIPRTCFALNGGSDRVGPAKK